MRKKFKKSIALMISSVALLILTCAMFLIGMVGCNQGDKLQGFDVRSSLTVDYGSTVELETPFVTDKNGWVLENWAMVTDCNGNYVYTENGRFVANDPQGYTITYVVRDADENIFEKQTKITVKGSADQQVRIDVEYEQDVVTNTEIAINATCSEPNAELQYAVTRKSDGTSVAVQGNTFTLTQAGAYDVSVRDSEGKAEYKYMLFAQDPAEDGEVEKFNTAWAERQRLTGSKRRTWDVVSSEECGILDPYGQPATYATFTSNKAYISLYLTMRQSKEYYEQLAQEGYKSVSMWIYIEGQKTHNSVADRDPMGGSFYRKDGPKLSPGKWMQYTMNLVDSAAAYNRSFVSCYDYYQKEAFRYLLVDNSWDWNPAGGGDEITFYITDVYATKTMTITSSSTVETQRFVDEEIEFAPLFTADCELEYSITYRGTKLGMQDLTYAFRANGDYTVTAVPKARNLRGSSSITFEVADAHTMHSTPLIKERTATQTSISLTDLQMQFAATNGIQPEITDCKVYYNGKEIKNTNDTFIADADGCYTVESKGEYTLDGVPHVSYKTTTVDVWSAETKYAFIDSKNLLYSSIYTDWDPDPTGSYKEYTIDGRTGQMIRSYSKGQSNSVYGKPLYSKNYYQKMLEEKPNAQLVLDIYIEATGGTSEYVRGLFTAYKTSSTVKNNGWRRYAITLQKMIEEYDTLTDKYESYKEIKDKGSRPNQSSNGTGALMLLFGDKSYAREVYMQVYMAQEAETASAMLKTGNKFDLESGNDLIKMLDVRLDGTAAEILSIDVKFNDAWVHLTDGVFTPNWADEYDFRINARTADAYLYKNFETTLLVGESDFTYIEDEETYTLIGDDDFDFANLTNAQYTFDFEIFTDGGYKTTVNGAEIDGTLIKGASLANGSYLVNVYAVKGEGAFSRILYYTFTINHFEQEGDMQWSLDLTADNYKTVLQRYHYADANSSLSSAISLTETIPEGGVAGTYVKYAQNAKSEDFILAIKPAYNQAYYQSLIDNDPLNTYTLQFDVYVENQDPTWTKTTLQKKCWNGTGSFSSSGSVKIGEWQTIKVDLEYYLKKWGDFRTFGLNFLNNGYYDNNQRVNFYLGNIRIVGVEKEMLWAHSDVLPSNLYQYATTTTNINQLSITENIPEGGVPGSYIKFSQTQGIDQAQFRLMPVYEKSYYEALLKDTTKNYKVYFDVYFYKMKKDADDVDGDGNKTEYTILVETGTITPRVLQTATSTSLGGGTAVALNKWHTFSYDLSTLVNAWGTNSAGPWFFGCATNTGQNPRTYFYLGNIRLVEEK